VDNNFPWSRDTAADRLEAVLDRLNGGGEATAVFLKLLEGAARKQAAIVPQNNHPLAGALISVKALFDVEGETTTAATRVLVDDSPAAADAPCIAALRDAGGIFVGLTNMSEFAYSGLGLNPHYGTPQNAVYPGSAPGGSTSGGAVSVALGLCDIAIGSDTGGSLRIPAAFNGIVGFKPTQASVSREGGKALSDSLDSFGPMARTVEACELAWQVMGLQEISPAGPDMTRRLIVPTNFGFDEIAPEVASGFEGLLSELKDQGFDIVEVPLDCISTYEGVPPWHLTSVEARGHYDRFFQEQADQFDARVHARMALADKLTAVEYRKTVNRREKFVREFSQELADDLLLMPTTPILPPQLSILSDDDQFNRHNLLALRNPSLANVGNGCGLALPFSHGGKCLSAMLIGAKDRDHQLLACGKAIEAVICRKFV